MGKLTLILGGARSGKSTYAQRLAASQTGQVVFIATAQAGDPEMTARISAHQRERPAGWQTLEAPLGIASVWHTNGIQADVAILDCLTLLVTNLLLSAASDLDAPDEVKAMVLIKDEIESLLGLIRECSCHWIIVSNEVGLGLVPAYPVGRLFRDWLGWANQRIAEAADEVYWLVAGIPVPIHTFR